MLALTRSLQPRIGQTEPVNRPRHNGRAVSPRRRRRHAFAAAAVGAALFFAGCGAATTVASAVPSISAVPHTIASSVRVGGRVRSYLIYAPSTRSPRPLVLVYHGALDTAAETAQQTDLLQVARQRGLIVAFLQGYDDTWNEGAGHTPAERAHVDDVAFTRAVLHQIESRHRVDRSRIAATGLSNGALLTEFLGCRLAADLTLIAPVEGELPVSVSSGCRPQRPISVFEVHGTADHTIPYTGGPFAGVGGGTTVLSAHASAARWASLDGCGSRPRGSSSGVSVLAAYSGCRGGVSVTLDSITGGGHVWLADIGVVLANFLAKHPAHQAAAAA
jgi:polyhydroxybutyrate depolymerase